MLKFMEKMMGFMIDRTSKEEKQEMMPQSMPQKRSRFLESLER